ncbi:predicted protein [Plenodomus lingam JN3]|uniref:Predicted protein n=1 Tax=Leptosphaeria maculans (strain JN3 / isolate v23.1.3 / race Av1-4-5-6-7-8) TaxID=985895 RepID=E4ZVR8_LEPMJ|nr:predicted protein [Plenodomus lingam JN3]CBX95694.1 predicted protein [Plenodomus lingam JN3]
MFSPGWEMRIVESWTIGTVSKVGRAGKVQSGRCPGGWQWQAFAKKSLIWLGLMAKVDGYDLRKLDGCRQDKTRQDSARRNQGAEVVVGGMDTYAEDPVSCARSQLPNDESGVPLGLHRQQKLIQGGQPASRRMKRVERRYTYPLYRRPAALTVHLSFAHLAPSSSTSRPPQLPPSWPKVPEFRFPCLPKGTIRVRRSRSTHSKVMVPRAAAIPPSSKTAELHLSNSKCTTAHPKDNPNISRRLHKSKKRTGDVWLHV